MESDVIVVGAGSAGAALAARLSEDPSRQVLLLEAGRDYRPMDAPPGLQSTQPNDKYADPDFLRTYTYPSLTASRTAAQEPAAYQRGRGVGGTSAVNGLVAIRPLVEDFDEWAAEGCTGWSYREVLPLLNRLEDDADFPDAEYHGRGGPIPVVRPRAEHFSTAEQAIREAAEQLGHGWAPDHNAPGTTGISPYAYNARGGRRISTNDGYLEPARGRPNLRIVGEALVDRVLFEGELTVGVRAIVAGESVDFRSGEVVLSAGAIHSPAILMRSGIGPAADLRKLGVDVQCDLPVGLGVQEHAILPLLFSVDGPADPGGGDPRHTRCCIRFDTGVDGDVNDAMLLVLGNLEHPDVRTETRSPWSAPPRSDGPARMAGGMLGLVNRASSTGRVRLASPDPAVEPVVELDMLSAEADLRRMRRIVDEMLAIAAQPSMQKISTQMGLGYTMEPFDTVNTAAGFAEFAKAWAMDAAHTTSSCRMGAPGDPRSVLDSECRVMGVEGLRVADASVLPSVPRANTHLSAVLVGEKVAALIAGGHQL